MATTYSLSVKIDPEQVKIMKENGYKLCLSKKVNGKYTVVWQGTTFAVTNSFRWTEQYQTFASQKFSEGALVEVGTNKVPIALGQTATVDSNGTFGRATGPVNGDHFTVKNEWGLCHIGVDQLLNGKFSTIFVDPKQMVKGTMELTPIVSVMLWFDRTYQTGSMFTRTQSSSFEVSYLGQGDSLTVSYHDVAGDGNGVWIDGDASSGALNAVIPRSYSVERGFEVLPAALDAFYISTIISSLKVSDTDVASFADRSGDIVAYMSFPYVAAATKANADIAVYLQSGWPGGFNMSAVTVGDRTINSQDPSQLIVKLENREEPGGPTDVVRDAWNGFWKYQYPTPLIYYRKH